MKEMKMFKMDTNSKLTTILGKGTELKGGFSSPGSVRIDGIVRGDVIVTGSLILGPEGKIFGNVAANSVMIGGQVEGDLTAQDMVEIVGGAASVHGDISTSRLLIDGEAVFLGRCSAGPVKEEADEVERVEEQFPIEKEESTVAISGMSR